MRLSFEFEHGEPLLTLDELHRRAEAAYLSAVVARVGNRSQAASVLGISRKNLWERLKRLGLSHLSKTPTDTDASPLRIAA